MKTLELKTHTPIAIGNGHSLSQLTDFILREDRQRGEKKIEVLDQGRFLAFLEANNQAFKIYNQVVFQGNSQSRNPTLRDLESQIGNLDLFTSYSLPAAKAATGRTDIQQVVKNAGTHPYIPGSSLKGGIKTALLHEWLTTTSAGKQTLDKVRNIIKGSDKLNSKIKEAEKQIFHSSKKFDKRNDNGKQFGVSDGGLLEAASLKVRRLERYNLSNGKSGTPQEWESINPDVTAQVQLTPGSQTLDQLLSAISAFSLDATQHHIRLLEQTEGDNNNNKHQALLSFFQDKEEQLQDGAVFMRTGFGKGFFFNSIGPAFYKVYGNDGLQDLLKLNKVNQANRFPITHLMDVGSNLPLGWVQLKR